LQSLGETQKQLLLRIFVNVAVRAHENFWGRTPLTTSIICYKYRSSRALDNVCSTDCFSPCRSAPAEPCAGSVGHRLSWLPLLFTAIAGEDRHHQVNSLVDQEKRQLYSSTIMTAQSPPAKSCPVCKTAMVFMPDDPSLGYDVFVCKNCNTKYLVHHPTPDSEEED
jgi:hypothetical protein